MASSYSMKPKPFMSLISLIVPVPWVAKWASTSALVAIGRSASLGSQDLQARGVHAVEFIVARMRVSVLSVLTIAREVAQVEPCGGHLIHIVKAGG
jgi:hypothetical protein